MDPIDEFVRRQLDLAVDRVHRIVRPLGVFSDTEDPEPAGSAVLIWHRGKRYLVTAAHVLDLLPPGKGAIGTMSKWVHMPGPWQATNAPGGDREKDRFDIAFTEVSEQGASLLDGCEFAQSSMIGEPAEVVHDGHYRSKYVFIGYPLHKFEFRRAAGSTDAPYQPLATPIMSEEEHASLKLSPQTHIACHYNEKKVVSDGGLKRGPKLVGMSGGGVFRFRSLEVPGILALPMLAGVIIEQDRQRDAIIATRIGVIQSAIDAAG